MIMFRIFWNRCSHGPWPIFTKLPCSKWRLLYIRIEWSWLVEANCTHTPTKKKNFQSFYKKTIDLVREWFLRQCTVESRYLKPTRDIEKVQAIGSSSYQELSPKDRKRKKEKRKKGKKGFTIFLISCFYSYSVVHGNIKFNFRFPSVFSFPN